MKKLWGALLLTAFLTSCTRKPPPPEPEADLTGPIYVASNYGAVSNSAKALIFRRKNNLSAYRIETVFQPDYRQSYNDDPGGIVLLFIEWAPRDLDKIDMATVSEDELLDKATPRFTSGNGIEAVKAYCANMAVQDSHFCRRANGAALAYILTAKTDPQPITVRMDGNDVKAAPEEIRDHSLWLKNAT